MPNGKRYKKKKRIQSLLPQERKIVYDMIRKYCKESSLYYFGHKDGYPPEKIEEMIEWLIDKGTLTIFVSEDKKSFTII